MSWRPAAGVLIGSSCQSAAGTPAPPGAHERPGRDDDDKSEANDVDPAPVEEDVPNGGADGRSQPEADGRPDRRGDRYRRGEHAIGELRGRGDDGDRDPKAGDMTAEDNRPRAPSVKPRPPFFQPTFVEVHQPAD